MDIMIIGMSIFAYLLIFNRCLTFKLTIMNNLIITAIMAFYMIVIDEITGALFVLPMFLTLICYIYWLKKEDVLWNIFLLLFSYMLVVIVDNVSHFFWKLAGIEPANLWITYFCYSMMEFPIIFIICGWISKKAREIKKKQILFLSPKIAAVVGTDLLLCMIVFAIHITITNQAGSPPQLLAVSIGLYVAYFALTFVMVTMIIREYEINAKITMKQNSYDNLQEYMSQIEELYQKLCQYNGQYGCLSDG